MMLMAPKWIRATDAIGAAALNQSPAGLYPRQSPPLVRHEVLLPASYLDVTCRVKGGSAMTRVRCLGRWRGVPAPTHIPRLLIA
jgi:hypothetical protein